MVWLRWRRHARACVLALAATGAQTAVRGRLEVKAAWKESLGVGMPRKLIIRYDPAVRATLGAHAAGRLAAAMSTQLGVAYTVKAHKPIRNKVVLVEGATKVEGALEVASERVRAVAEQVFGPTATVAIKESEKGLLHGGGVTSSVVPQSAAGKDVDHARSLPPRVP